MKIYFVLTHHFFLMLQVSDRFLPNDSALREYVFGTFKIMEIDSPKGHISEI